MSVDPRDELKKAAMARADDQRKQRDNDLRSLMVHPPFRRLVRKMLHDTGYYLRGAGYTDIGDIKYWLGRREVGVSLLEEITSAIGHNALLELLETEANDERS